MLMDFQLERGPMMLRDCVHIPVYLLPPPPRREEADNKLVLV